MQPALDPDRKTVWLCVGLLGLFLSYLVLYLIATLSRGDAFPFGDFFALWSYPRIVLTHPAATLYDPAALHDAQVALGMADKEKNPFPYPPTFLMMLWPLGQLPYGAAYLAWVGVSLLLYVVATCAGTRPATLLVPAALLAPTTTINLVAGQSGFLSAALLVGGLRLVAIRPALAGVLFGLLTYKPQFGIMVPVALLALGQWRCIAVAGASAVVAGGLATLAYGGPIWAAWLHSLPDYAAWFDQLAVRYFMPTVTENLRMMGMAPAPVRLIQASVALGAAVLVWIAFRRRPPGLAIPALLVATCLATPHAFVYDLPMLSAGVLLFVAHRLHTGATLGATEIAVLVLVLVFPAIMAFGARLPISSVALALFAVLILITGRAGDARIATVPLGA